ncbi:MAG: hypothetical protein R3C44_24715 [Chloroflexota bacterium]
MSSLTNTNLYREINEQPAVLDTLITAEAANAQKLASLIVERGK